MGLAGSRQAAWLMSKKGICWGTYALAEAREPKPEIPLLPDTLCASSPSQQAGVLWTCCWEPLSSLWLFLVAQAVVCPVEQLLEGGIRCVY